MPIKVRQNKSIKTSKKIELCLNTVGDFAIKAIVSYKNIRHSYLRLKPGGSGDIELHISVPDRASQKYILELIERNKAWLEGKLASKKALNNRPFLPANQAYTDGARLRLWGIDYTLRLRTQTYHKLEIEKDTKEISIYYKAGEDMPKEVIKASVIELYRAELKKILPQIVPPLEILVGKKASEWKIRRMTSRWGSCNVLTAKITLNLWLARYDREILKYVIIHELTHLWVRGHGKDFRRHMDKYLPNWRELRARLKG